MANSRYRIETVLGTGGAGVVCKAFDALEGRTVALKRLAANESATPRDVQRAQALFEREYHVLAQLAHPRIIEVYDYGVDDEGPYYTMEWLRGASLRERSPLALAEACSLVRDVASSLAILHSRRLVHRDVTPRNIHCSEDGNAKLIDFGAMTPFGVAKFVIGTPPFIAPECIQFQPVDGRTDLFSLGACLYYALTGRHAYPARTIAELHTCWLTTPQRPSRFVHAVPEALDRLILELLSLQPAGRPGSAAEVFERLTTAAGLDAGEHPTVARAYLARPALAGRRRELARIRRRMIRAVRGRGSSIVVTGRAGAGRSRLFEAAVLEAKLSGFTVLRADNSEGRAASFAAIHSMVRELAEVAPEASELLAASGEVDESGAGASRARNETINALAHAICEVSRGRSVAVAVDDVHIIDDESLATLALLADAAKGLRLFVLTTLDTEELRPRDPALSLLLGSSARIEVGPLSGPETRTLLSSLFGEIPNLDTVSAVAHETTRGLARELLDAAQELVDNGLATYAGGAWTISGDPKAIEGVLAGSTDVAHRVQTLHPDARKLLSVLALDRDMQIGLRDYAGVAFGGDRVRANQALTDLVQSELVTLVEDRCRFGREAVRDAIVQSLPSETRRELHGRLAERTEAAHANPIYPAYHFFLAGKPEESAAAVDRFRGVIEARPDAPILNRSIVQDALELIVCSDADFSDNFRAGHGAGMVMNAVYQGLPERAAPHTAEFLQRLSRLTALDDYHARTDLDPGARLGITLGLAHARCSEDPRGLDPVNAVRRLCQLSISTALCARFMADPHLLAGIPDLSPFAPLSPGVALAARLVSAMGMLVRGQDWEAWDAIDRLRAELRAIPTEGLDALTRLSLESVALGQLCALEAEHACATALQHIDEYTPRAANMAESCRARYYLAEGMLAKSELARRNFEILSVRTSGSREARIIELPTYLGLHAMSDDVLGLKRTLGAIAEVARTRPRWKSRVALASAHLHRCRGEIGVGLATIERSLAELPPEHGDWAPSAALRIALLDLAGNPAGAVDAGVAYLAESRKRRVPPVGLMLSLALAFANAGNEEAAEDHVNLARVALEARGV
ncbi:MAG TPA: protein kinase, partial [Polyangiaceae bacterium]|nr:protein kinase [Polyangiaceae bacterium]